MKKMPLSQALCALGLGLLLACSGSAKTSPATGAASAPANKPAAIAFNQAHITAELDRYLGGLGAKWGESQKFTGYAHLVSGDRVLYSKGFGWADHAAKREHNADTSFRIGSVTKQFTAAAIMLLLQDGKLKLTDTIGTHLPDYPAKVGAQVTLHQLLNHTSGIPIYTAIPEVLATRDKPRSVEQLLALFKDKPLEFEPGSKMKYNNSGYALLGAIIEAISQQSYAEFLRTRIFEPAALTRTVVGDAAKDENRAKAYEEGDDGKLVAAHAIDMSLPYAAGAIRSTANDLVRWERVLRAGTLVTHASQELMWKTDKVTHKSGTGYGYGWLVTKTRDTFVHHDGRIDGFSSYFLRAMNSDLVLVLYANKSTGNVSAIKEVMVAVAFGGKAPANDNAGPSPLDPAETARIIGSYALTTDSREAAKKLGVPDAALDTIKTMKLEEVNGALRLTPSGQEGSTIHRKSANVYVAPRDKATFTFEYNAGTEKAARLVLTQGPLSLTFIRQ